MQDVALPASCRLTRAVAEVLIERAGVLLHASRRAAITASNRAVDYIKTTLPLVQSHLEVRLRGWGGEIDRAPFDVEDTVGRSARDGREDTASAVGVTRAASVCIGAQVVPIRERDVGAGCVRQTTVREDRRRVHKLQCAIGIHVRHRKRLVIQAIGEGQRDRRGAIVNVIARVRRAWHDTATDLRYIVVVLRRATFYRVHPREGRITIARVSSD